MVLVDWISLGLFVAIVGGLSAIALRKILSESYAATKMQEDIIHLEKCLMLESEVVE